MTLPGPEGHLRMPNFIVERLARLRLNGTQWQILWAAWQQCCDAADGDETAWRRQLEMFRRGTDRLYILCLQLKASGFTKCLYDTSLCLGTTEITCWACPVTDRSTIGRSVAMPVNIMAPVVGSSTTTSRGAISQADRMSGMG
jgi:hypothetical protein